jgi:membrane glycosyltransferase
MMLARRIAVACIAVLFFATLSVPLLLVLLPGGWTIAKILMLVGFLFAAPWVGFCFANGIIGWAILVFGRDPDATDRISGSLPPIAIALTVRNEDMALVLPAIGQLLRDLDANGGGDAFTLFVLSDTHGAAAIEAEESAIAAFRSAHGAPDRIRYCRRAENIAFKAGNIMDFLDRHADDYELMLVLDADSRMTARAVLRLVGTMLRQPSLGLAQHLTVGLPALPPFPRLFQFGMRAGMRNWATAIAWWQDGEACYWGHNAVLRCRPFRDHCRLPLLPGGRHILSHDQVEGAMLAGAGWGVRLLASEDGSFETNPPALPEHLRRELRWMAGNFEYRHLLSMPGLRPMGRCQLLLAIVLFGANPFYLVFLGGAGLAAATDSVSAFPFWPALALTLGWMGGLYAPKLLGYLETLLSPRKRARYGGGWRLLRGAMTETCFTLLYDAIGTISKTVATLRVLVGAQGEWAPQNRTDRGVTWGEAARLLWPQTLIGIAAMLAFASNGWVALLWSLPLIGGLPLSIPFCVLTSNPDLGAWMRRRGLAATPEEVRPQEG